MTVIDKFINALPSGSERARWMDTVAHFGALTRLADAGVDGVLRVYRDETDEATGDGLVLFTAMDADNSPRPFTASWSGDTVTLADGW